MLWIKFTYLGRKLAKKGVLLEIAWMSSIVNGTSAALAIASIWSTAFVDPPSTIITVNAFSNAFVVKISLGRIFFWIRLRIAGPTRRHSWILAGSSAGIDELYGNDIPNASIALDTIHILVNGSCHLWNKGQNNIYAIKNLLVLAVNLK